MEKKALLALVISLIILVFYQSYFAPPEPRSKKGKEVSSEKQETEGKALPFLSSAEKREIETSLKGGEVDKRKGKGEKEKEVVVKTELYTATFTSKGARVKSWELHRYKDKPGPEGKAINLVTVRKEEYFPLFLNLEEANFSFSPELVYEVNSEGITLDRKEKGELIFSSKGEGVEIIKKFTFFRDSYGLNLDLMIINQGKDFLKGKTVLNWLYNPSNSGSSNSYQGDSSSFVSLIEENMVKDPLQKLKEEKVYSGKIKWAGFEDKYFISSLISRASLGDKIKLAKLSDNLFLSQFISPLFELPPKKGFNISYSLYLGPKDLDLLKAQGVGLEKALDFGWFDLVAKPLLVALKYLNRLTHNYGLAIILLTFAIKIIFFPLSHKSFKSMKEMQKLQPKIAILRERYKNDKQKLNQETMQLYRTHKVNPLGGCLPIVVQIPVFFALYKVLLESIELRHAPFLFWIQDLSAKDPYYITPLLMGASMFIQQKMTPTSGDPTQAKIMLFMPIIFTVMFLGFPSGLVIYWLVNNILSIIQQLYTNKYLK